MLGGGTREQTIPPVPSLLLLLATARHPLRCVPCTVCVSVPSSVRANTCVLSAIPAPTLCNPCRAERHDAYWYTTTHSDMERRQKASKSPLPSRPAIVYPARHLMDHSRDFKAMAFA